MESLSKIDAVVLCGGLGRRLRRVLGGRQKVLASVGGHPFLDIILSHLKKQGIRRVVLCTGYKADLIEQYYSLENFGLKIEFSREQQPLGTGGAIQQARSLVRSNPFFALNGDSFCPANLRKFFKLYREKKGIASVVVSSVKDKKDFGSIALDRSGRIVSFEEKKEGTASRLVNAGIYCFDKKIFPLMPRRKGFSLEYDCFPRWVEHGVFGYVTERKFYDIGTPERLKKAKQIFKKGFHED